MNNWVGALSASVAAIAIGGASAAHADIFLSTYAAHIDYHDDTASNNEVFQRINAPQPGPAQSSADGSSLFVLDTWKSSAKAEYGGLHARADGYIGTFLSGTHSIHNGASSYMEDDLVFNTGNPGESGLATFSVLLDGELTAYATSAAYVSFTSSGTTPFFYYLEGKADDDPPQTHTVSELLIFRVPFVSGRATHIYAGLGVGADFFFNGPGQAWASADFSHTAKWGGLQSVVNAGGQDITQGTTISAASGFDYVTAPPGAVPEPSMWALLIAGFGLAGTMLRRRTQPCPGAL